MNKEKLDVPHCVAWQAELQRLEEGKPQWRNWQE
jgi:hypothetical protein